jgi:hypothetical protein
VAVLPASLGVTAVLIAICAAWAVILALKAVAYKMALSKLIF